MALNDAQTASLWNYVKRKRKTDFMQCRKILERVAAVFFSIWIHSRRFCIFPDPSPGSFFIGAAGKGSYATDLGVSFVKDSASQIVVERDGKKYVVDLVTRDIRETDPEPAPSTDAAVASSQVPTIDSQSKQEPVSSQNKSENENKNVYKPGDDFVSAFPRDGRSIVTASTSTSRTAFPMKRPLPVQRVEAL